MNWLFILFQLIIITGRPTLFIPDPELKSIKERKRNNIASPSSAFYEIISTSSLPIIVILLG
ncbi:MAG: hypothetical protein ABI091_20325 [Ferruginibacter sp.]